MTCKASSRINCVLCAPCSVRDPETFWERQRLYAPSGASCNKIVGNFMTFLTVCAMPFAVLREQRAIYLRVANRTTSLNR